MSHAEVFRQHVRVILTDLDEIVRGGGQEGFDLIRSVYENPKLSNHEAGVLAIALRDVVRPYLDRIDQAALDRLRDTERRMGKLWLTDLACNARYDDVRSALRVARIRPHKVRDILARCGIFRLVATHVLRETTLRALYPFPKTKELRRAVTTLTQGEFSSQFPAAFKREVASKVSAAIVRALPNSVLLRHQEVIIQERLRLPDRGLESPVTKACCELPNLLTRHGCTTYRAEKITGTILHALGLLHPARTKHVTAQHLMDMVRNRRQRARRGRNSS